MKTFIVSSRGNSKGFRTLYYLASILETNESDIPKLINNLNRSEKIMPTESDARTNMYYILGYPGMTPDTPHLDEQKIALNSIYGRRNMTFNNEPKLRFKPATTLVDEYIKNDIASLEKLATTFVSNEKVAIKTVYFSGPCTIVIWTDGTKTMVHQDTERDPVFDAEKGLALAIAKKFLGTNNSKSNYYDEFKKWLPGDEK